MIATEAHSQESGRLQFGLLLALAFHVFIILGIKFSPPDVPDLKSNKVQVTYVQPKQDTETPEDATLKANANQQGGGDENRQQKRAETVQTDALSQELLQSVQAQAQQETQTVKETPKPKSPRLERPQDTSHNPANVIEKRKTGQSFAQQALQNLQQNPSDFDDLYNSSDNGVYRLTGATTLRDRGAWYMEAWKRKVERIGNKNFPLEVKQKNLSGEVLVLVAINRDGSLHHVQILRSSGNKTLDNAVLRIVKLAAPYSPLTGDLANLDMLEITRVWRFEK